jgi:hypothetical protein
VLGTFLTGSLPLLILWRVGGFHRLYRSTLMLSTGILLLFAAFIFWPAYHSGMDWSMGEPNRVGEGWSYYKPWYVAAMEWSQSEVLASALWFTLSHALVATWYTLIPLGLTTLALLHSLWPQLDTHERWASISLSLLALVVPVLTWTLSRKVANWLFH